MKTSTIILLIGLAVLACVHAANIASKPGPYPYILPPQPNIYTPPHSTNLSVRADVVVTNLPPLRDWLMAGRLYPNVNTNSVKVSMKTGRISFQYGEGTSRGTITANINELPPPVAAVIVKQLPYKKPGTK